MIDYLGLLVGLLHHSVFPAYQTLKHPALLLSAAAGLIRGRDAGYTGSAFQSKTVHWKKLDEPLSFGDRATVRM